MYGDNITKYCISYLMSTKVLLFACLLLTVYLFSSYGVMHVLFVHAKITITRNSV